MGWKTFRDRLALVLIVAILVIIIADKWITVAADWRGALIVILTLVGQFYFRRKDPDESPPPTEQRP